MSDSPKQSNLLLSLDMAKSTAKRWQSYLLLTINTVVWGAAFIVTKPALEITTPFRFLTYRYLIASLVAVPMLIYFWPEFKRKVGAGKIASKLSQIIGIEIIGSGLALAALYVGLNLTSALEANLIATTVPIFVTLGGVFLLKEKIEKHEFKGLSIAFIGTIFLTLIPFFSLNGQFTNFSIWGNLLIILHNLANVFYFPLAKKVYQGLPKFFVSGIAFFVALTFFTALSYWESGFINWQELKNLNVFWPAFYMAIFGSVIGLTTYIKGQENIETSEASLFWYLQPLVYIPLGYFVLNEHINVFQLIALIIVLCGVYLAEKRK